MIQSVVSVIFYARGMCVENEGGLCKGVVIFLQVSLMLGIAGFFSNIIQFNMDQLQEASTIEITSFVVWYVWTWSFGILFGIASSSCFNGVCKLATILVIPISVSVALCLDSCFGHWLVKEPVSHHNPYRLFLGVLCYAVRNKYPRQRSAFTYWEDKPYTRIDLAKDKYGGPFTTEQVEDVKIVLRIMVMLATACVGVSLSFYISDEYDKKVLHHLRGSHSSESVQLWTVRQFSYFAILFFIPIHEFVIYPLLREYVIQMSVVVKFSIGLLSLVLHYSSLLVIEVVGYSAFPDKDATCFLHDNSNMLLLSFRWYFIPELFLGLCRFYLSWSCVELICSQAPYNMKGVLFGMSYFLVGISSLLVYLLLLPVTLTVKNWHPVMYGCGVWFYLGVTVFYLIFMLVCIFVFKKVYKMRRRDEDLHNRHIFAINYYSHYIQYNEET
jgi:peptide/histidine transporter 3/4